MMCIGVNPDICVYNISGTCELLSEPFDNGKRVGCIKLKDEQFDFYKL